MVPFLVFVRLFIVLLLVVGGTSATGGDKAVYPTPTSINTLNITEQSVRQTVCHRYGNSELRTALSGMTLRPILRVGKFFNYDEDTGIPEDGDPGLTARLLDELGQRANFTWRNSFAISYGPEENSTWTEMLELYTEMFDISIDNWDKSTERLNKGIAFLERWFDGNMILIEKVKPPKDENKVNYTNYLRPFTANVWYATLATVILSALIYQWLEFMHNERDKRSFSQWYLDNLYLSSMNFSQNYSYEPVSPAGRLFGFSMAIWAMVMGATYTANLASLFVERSGPPATIQDIDEAIRKQVRMCTWRGTNADLYIKNRYPQAIRVPKETELEAYQGLQTGECGLTIGSMGSWLGYELDSEYNPNCDLNWVGRTIEEVNSAFAVKADPAILCTNLIRDVLNYHLSEMTTDGTMESLWNEYYKANKDIDCLGIGNVQTSEQSRRLEQLLPSTTTQSTDTQQPNQQSASRLLKGGGGGGSTGAAAAAGGAADDDDESSSLSMQAMAGTFVLHAALSGLAILVGLASHYRSGRSKAIDSERSEGVSEETKMIPIPNDKDLHDSNGVAALSLASGTSDGNVHTFVPKTGNVQEHLEHLQIQQQLLSQQMTLVVSLLSKTETHGDSTPLENPSSTDETEDESDRGHGNATSGGRFISFFS